MALDLNLSAPNLYEIMNPYGNNKIITPSQFQNY